MFPEPLELRTRDEFHNWPLLSTFCRDVTPVVNAEIRHQTVAVGRDDAVVLRKELAAGPAERNTHHPACKHSSRPNRSRPGVPVSSRALFRASVQTRALARSSFVRASCAPRSRARRIHCVAASPRPVERAPARREDARARNHRRRFPTRAKSARWPTPRLRTRARRTDASR